MEDRSVHVYCTKYITVHTLARGSPVVRCICIQRRLILWLILFLMCILKPDGVTPSMHKQNLDICDGNLFNKLRRLQGQQQNP